MNKPFSLSEFLPYRLAVISERVSRRLAEGYGRSHGLSVAEWRVLVHLEHCGVVSVRDIQVFTNLEKSRVSRAVSRLQKAGLVRKQASQVDARLIEIALSDTGKTALRDVLEEARETERRLLSGLHASDLAAFYKVIEHLHEGLDQDPLSQSRPKPVPANKG